MKSPMYMKCDHMTSERRTGDFNDSTVRYRIHFKISRETSKKRSRTIFSVIKIHARCCF